MVIRYKCEYFICLTGYLCGIATILIKSCGNNHHVDIILECIDDKAVQYSEKNCHQLLTIESNAIIGKWIEGNIYCYCFIWYACCAHNYKIWKEMLDRLCS